MSEDALIEVSKVTISDYRGLVCLTFEQQCDRLTLNPQEAVQMGEALSRQAYRAHYGDYPHNGSKQTVEQLRVRARNRVEMMLVKHVPDDTTRKALATDLTDRVIGLVR
tara:strand:- start:454 stop:780 length:327 start_codon:yes stop_codon:yes gene_type:complete